MPQHVEDSRRRLEEAEGFGEIFELVKRLVEDKLGFHRAGLSLILATLPNYILARHQVGSNYIEMNRWVYEVMRSTARSKVEVNSYVFVILLHEYLHSLGVVSEAQVRSLVQQVVESAFGADHTAKLIASNPHNYLHPEILSVRPPEGEDILIKDFDRESMPYIG